MRLGTRREPRYICDKCGKEIVGYHKNSKKHITPDKYFKADKYGQHKKDFELCKNCEKLFRKWLNEKEIPTLESMLDRFEEYKEGKWGIQKI